MYKSVDIGKRIKTQRELLGITREELAEKIGITPRFCYDLELGLKGMSVQTLYKLVETLHVSSDYLLFGEQNIPAGIEAEHGRGRYSIRMNRRGIPSSAC